MMFFKRLVWVAAIIACGLFAAQANAAQSKIETRIVGGTESTSGQWSWMVALSTSSKRADLVKDQFCGGSLIDRGWVVTAAHCVVNEAGVILLPNQLHAFVGEWDLRNSSGSYSAIEKIIVHPNYNRLALDNDVALLKLSSPLPVDAVTLDLISNNAVTELNARSNDLDNDVQVLGWGDTEVYDPAIESTFPDVLHEVNLPLVSNATCSDVMGGQITDNMLCAGLISGGYDSCQGDSGGPMVFTDSSNQPYLAGVISWGNGCAEANSYGVYARIENMRDWLQKTIVITPEVNFGQWIEGKTVTGKIEINYSSGPVFNITSIQSSDENIFAFTSDKNICIRTFSAGDSCVIDLEFLASIDGRYLGEITLVTDNPDLATISVNLTGEILPLANLSVLQNDGSVDSEIQWALSGDTNWGEKLVTVNSGYSLESGAIDNSQTSSLFAYVTVSGVTSRTLYFDWKVCSEPEWDYLELWVDNVKQDGLSGNVDWFRKEILLKGEKDHVIEWRYNKDVLFSKGSDAGWVDNVSFNSVASLPQHATSCVIDPPASSGGAISGWLYLGLGFPLLMRRRNKFQ